MKTIFKFKTRWMLAIMCVAVMTLPFIGCNWDEIYESEVGYGLQGTWAVYKADVVVNGEVLSVDVNNYNEYKGLYRHLGLKSEGECYMKYNDYVGYSYFEGDIYRWTRVPGVYSSEDDVVIVRCEEDVYEFSHNEDDNILCGEVPFHGKGDITVKVYLKKISKCYL
jgi:hypothetical protein